MTCARTTNRFDENNELSCNNYKCFKFLLSLSDDENDRGLCVNRRFCKTAGMGSVMMYCVQRKKIECIKLLIDHCRKHGLNFKDDCTSSNSNALMSAMSMANNETMVRLLMQNSDLFDLNQQSYDGCIFTRPLSRSPPSYDDNFAMECDYKKYLDVIFDEMSKNGGDKGKSFDPTVSDMSGKGIFEWFVFKGCRIKFFDYFIQQAKDKCGWDIKQLIANCRNKDNDTLFHVVVRQSSITYLAYLLKLKVLDDINVIGGKNNDTLLNMCVESIARYDEVTYKSGVHFQVFKLLLSQPGINPNISNKFGYNAFDMCRRSQKLEYLKILNEWKQSK